MYNQCTLGAIFVFILCVHCDNIHNNVANNNEIKEIYVPSAPQNLSAKSVTAYEIHLSWAPPTTFTKHSLPLTATDTTHTTTTTKPDEPKAKIDVLSDEPIDQTNIPKIYEYSIDNEKFAHSDLLLDDRYRSKRDVRSHRHRKRRQENSTETKSVERAPEMDTHQQFDHPIEVKKKSVTAAPHKDATQIAYVLYYEQGVPGYDTSTVIGVPSSDEVKRKNVFPSDLGMEDKSTKNLTLLNTSGKVTQVVGFRLRNLRSFTPYKIWVRAFYNFSLDGVMSSDLLNRLGPQSESLYVLTDVRPPSAPVILNLTCDQPKGMLYLQWRQPLDYNNSLDQYVVSLRKLPELQPRTRLTLPSNKSDIETTISINAELRNVTKYEVKIYAVTKSVTNRAALINGTESPPEEVSSDMCAAHTSAEGVSSESRASAATLLAIAPLLLIAAVTAGIVYWSASNCTACPSLRSTAKLFGGSNRQVTEKCRSKVSKCISAAYNYLEEGGERGVRAPLNSYKKPKNQNAVSSSPCAAPAAAAAPPRPPRMARAPHAAVRAADFPRHCAALHADGDVGFSKEYEIVVNTSAALGHTSHHSHRPENRPKNRYLNITAYDHSRVCVSRGGRCGAAGCAGGGGGPAGGAVKAPCDYVNANFIDGILPSLSAADIARLVNRQPHSRKSSSKPAKPPLPILAEGIESAFLNIEFSGIVESEEQDEQSDEDSDGDDSLDDVYVDIDGVPTQVKLEWLIWRRRYIATQGPTPATLDCFWRMIWQHQVQAIVMITNLVERGRRKCDMYWPGGGRGSSATFGGVHVTLLHEDVRAAFTIRWMRIKALPGGACGDSSSGEGRLLVQYHYTVWPDHGTPRHPLAVLPLVRCAARHAAPVLVHCSAGVGRTGTYIVLDAQLNQLKLTGTLSPLGFLCRARTQRNHLVQTEEQYVFVHDALLEHVRSGDTDVPFEKSREYLAKLLAPISPDELALMDSSPPKNKSLNDLTNGYENGETSSVKSSQEVENGSEMSIKTDDLNSEVSKSSVRDLNGSQDESINREAVNGDETEGVYDLGPRSTDTYSKKMQAYNNMSEQEKEEIRRANRVENYALLERMRSLANRHHTYQGPPPVNLLEKQYQLITRCAVPPSVCARASHNAEKNRVGGILPSDTARVVLVPKPAVEGSEYINASWVSGRCKTRQYCVAQHPPPAAVPDLWRLLWDHTAQLLLLLEGDVFWPTEEEPELYVANFRATFVSKETYVAYRREDKKEEETASETPPTPEVNGYRRQGSDCADDERLIPENSSPLSETEPTYRFDRTELRLERLSTGTRDLSARKSIANGDLFSSFSEKRNGTKSPKSPSKMSLKNFRINSPTKLKFPEWGTKTAGTPPDMAPPPPPVPPSLTVEEEAELHRPCYTFEQVPSVPENIPTDRIIEVTNVSVHSLQDDYQLSVKFIKCSGWLEGDTTDYSAGKPDENEFVRAVREAADEKEREAAIDRLIEPYKDSFALIEFVAGCQMEYKNGPVVVVDKYGGWRAMSFCTLSTACGGARNPAVAEPGAEYRTEQEQTAAVYTAAALTAHARCATSHAPHSLPALLAAYCALAAYTPRLPKLITEPQEDSR